MRCRKDGKTQAEERTLTLKALATRNCSSSKSGEPWGEQETAISEMFSTPRPAEQQAIIHTHPAIFFVLSRRDSRYASQVTGQYNLIGKYSR